MPARLQLGGQSAVADHHGPAWPSKTESQSHSVTVGLWQPTGLDRVTSATRQNTIARLGEWGAPCAYMFHADIRNEYQRRDSAVMVAWGPSKRVASGNTRGIARRTANRK